jgi:hypothetical protein
MEINLSQSVWIDEQKAIWIADNEFPFDEIGKCAVSEIATTKPAEDSKMTETKEFINNKKEYYGNIFEPAA